MFRVLIHLGLPLSEHMRPDLPETQVSYIERML